ncbi:RES domain-containing protein [Pseudomonas sp. 1152_12]|uniref:RES domain-containing protein n=1 Tax=Pseudomonas sp. 1152_12 TaxID=2604455 RepID=UPI004063FDDB
MDLRKKLSLYFELKFGSPPAPSFEKYDPFIGVAGYCAAIRKYLIPDSTPDTVSFAELPFESRTYCKGSIFSRVRRIRNEKLEKLLKTPLKVSDFFPPASETAQARAGRFNAEGERTLYLADHAFVALKECGIEPGEHFLFSYFVLKTDMHFVCVPPEEFRCTKLLSALFKSTDENFYPVITRTYNDYLNHATHHGIAYDSVKVKENYYDSTWGEISSITNLALPEEKLPAAYLQVGWLARCDEHYRPYYLKMLLPDAKKKKRLTTLTYHNNKSRFMAKHHEVMERIAQLRNTTKSLIAREDYTKVTTTAFKLLPQV